MKVKELIPVKKISQRGSVPAGGARSAEFGTIGLKLLIGQPNGDTSKSSAPMAKYKPISGKAQGVSEGVNPQYLKGLNKAEKAEMKREIKHFSKMSHKDKEAYPDDWTADREYKKRGGKTKPSKYTEKYHRMFEEQQLIESSVDTALRNKAKQTGKPLSLLRKVYNRGLAAWRTGHRPGVSQHQWAMARVNSYLTGGKAAKVDKDLKA